MKKILLCYIALWFVGCANHKNFTQEIEKYRAEKIRENTTGDRHPLEVGDEKFIQFFPIQKKFRLVAEFAAATDTATFDMPTYSGKLRKYRRFGRLSFKLDGQKLELTLYQNLALVVQEKYKNHLFLPFKDASNGGETYGGGRYMDLATTDLKNGRMILDFNKIYNPWCAYSDGFNCPIPPAENHLQVGILAGEKNFLGEKKHPKH